MKFRILITAILLIGIKNSYAQNTIPTDQEKCSKLLNQVTYYWQLDSLGRNGYRFVMADRFLKCKIDYIKKEMLIEMLGNPNYISNDSKTTQYLYLFYDGAAIPAKFNKSFEHMFLSFSFNLDGDVLNTIYQGAQD